MTLVIGESSILTIFVHVKLCSKASFKALARSFPVPDYDNAKKPPYLISLKSTFVKSDGSHTLIVSKILSCFMI